MKHEPMSIEQHLTPSSFTLVVFWVTHFATVRNPRREQAAAAAAVAAGESHHNCCLSSPIRVSEVDIQQLTDTPKQLRTEWLAAA